MRNKKLIIVLFAIVSLLGSKLALASTITQERTITTIYQKAKSGLTGQGLTQVSTHGETITGIGIATAGAASGFEVYDSATIVPTPAASVAVFEAGLPVTQGAYFDLTNRPISTQNGLAVGCSGAGCGIIVYTEQP